MERNTCQEHKSENIKKNKDEDVKRMKVSLTNWVLTNQNKQNIGDDCSDRQGKIGHANYYGLLLRKLAVKQDSRL